MVKIEENGFVLISICSVNAQSQHCYILYDLCSALHRVEEVDMKNTASENNFKLLRATYEHKNRFNGHLKKSLSKYFDKVA